MNLVAPAAGPRPSVSIMAMPGTASVAELRDLGVSGVRVTPRDLLVEGRVSPEGVSKFRADWQPLVAAGLGLHLVTPWPRDLPSADPTTRRWERRWRAIGQELGRSMGDLVTSWQLGNELNLWFFRAPLRTSADVVRFVGALGGGVRDECPASRLGINAFGIDEGAVHLLQTIYGPLAPLELDFIGIDCYWGSYQPGGPSDWKSTLDLVWNLGGGRPLAVCEIGFPSAGDVSAPGELLAFLRTLGYTSLDEVERDRSRLLAAAPALLADAFASLPTESWADDFEDSACHLLGKWRRSWSGGPQSPEEQARYFRECLSFMLDDPRICDLMLFMFRDLTQCWACGRLNCPIETSWGFVDSEGRPKPVYAAVRELLIDGALP
jgi:hypothetical protein